MVEPNLYIPQEHLPKKLKLVELIRKTQKPPIPLSLLAQCCILSVLEETCNKLDILQKLLPCPNLKWEVNYFDLVSRFKVSKLVVLPEEVPSEQELKLTKIQQCRYFLKYLFRRTIIDIYATGTSPKLNFFLSCEYKTVLDEIIIRAEHQYLKGEKVSLKKQIEDLKHQTEDKLLYLTETKSRDMEQAKINAWVEQQVAESYVKHRETSRIQQVEIKNSESENLLENNLHDNGLTKDLEHRVNQEIESFLVMSKSELQEKLDEWTLKYNTEIEQRDVELLQLKNKQEEQKENMKSTLELFTQRHEEILVLRELADQHDREEEENIKQNKAALIIQRWWRNFWFLYYLQKLLIKRKKKKKK